MLTSFPMILCIFTLYGEITPSAIPVWELLSKDEKMSYLYSMFANQVENYCVSVENKFCNQELLKYGLRSLKSMSEDALDTMDPYQRGANNIIWTRLLEGHSLKNVIPKQQTTTTSKPNSYDGDLSFGVDEYGGESAETSKIDNVFRVPPPKGFVYVAPSPTYTINSDIPEYITPRQSGNQNELLFEDILKKPTPKPNVYNKYHREAPLTGPMEVRVYPDGTPVQEGPRNIPQDEDLQQYRLSQIRLPNV